MTRSSRDRRHNPALDQAQHGGMVEGAFEISTALLGCSFYLYAEEKRLNYGDGGTNSMFAQHGQNTDKL